MSILKDCEDLLKQAWKEVKCISTKNTKEKEVLLRALLVETGDKVDYPELESFGVLKKLLAKRIDPCENSLTGWISCKQMYESMLMLLNSNYKKYNLLDLGNAKYYFDKSIPLYCQLSGAKPPVIKNIQYNEQNKNDKYGLQSGLILDRLKKDIPEIAILTGKEYYKKALSSTVGKIAVATTQKYVVQLTYMSIANSGLVVGNTNYRITVNNIKTGKELKVCTYSDIKKILRRC